MVRTSFTPTAEFRLFGLTITYSPHSSGSNELADESVAVFGVRIPIDDSRRSCSSFPKIWPQYTAPRRGTNSIKRTGENTNDGRRTCQRAVAELRCPLMAM